MTYALIQMVPIFVSAAVTFNSILMGRPVPVGQIHVNSVSDILNLHSVIDIYMAYITYPCIIV